MISIFVCEDNPVHREHITGCINKYVMMQSLDMEVVLATASPYDVLDYLKKNSVTGLYFLDLDLSSDINGIELAEAIRTHDPRGFIVFITTDAESHVLTFKYKVEALDYIVKNNTDQDKRICECIQNAQDRFATKPALQNRFVFRLTKDTTGHLSKGSTIAIDYDKILFFETSPTTPHSIVIITENSRHEFRAKLAEIYKSLDGRFFQCHRSYIVNIDKVSVVDERLMKLHLSNGGTIDIAARHVKRVREMLAST